MNLVQTPCIAVEQRLHAKLDDSNSLVLGQWLRSVVYGIAEEWLSYVRAESGSNGR